MVPLRIQCVDTKRTSVIYIVSCIPSFYVMLFGIKYVQSAWGSAEPESGEILSEERESANVWVTDQRAGVGEWWEMWREKRGSVDDWTRRKEGGERVRVMFGLIRLKRTRVDTGWCELSYSWVTIMKNVAGMGEDVGGVDTNKQTRVKEMNEVKVWGCEDEHEKVGYGS